MNLQKSAGTLQEKSFEKRSFFETRKTRLEIRCLRFKKPV